MHADFKPTVRQIHQLVSFSISPRAEMREVPGSQLLWCVRGWKLLIPHPSKAMCSRGSARESSLNRTCEVVKLGKSRWYNFIPCHLAQAPFSECCPLRKRKRTTKNIKQKQNTLQYDKNNSNNNKNKNNTTGSYDVS